MRTPRSVRLSTGAAVLTGATALVVYGLTTTPAHVSGPSAAVRTVSQDKTVSASTITRAEVLARAKTWNPHTSQRIPYSQSRTHNGYRTDCSGYASMALALSMPGTNTVGLASSRYSTPIAMSQLQPGDLVIDSTGTGTTRHVVIFVEWADSSHTSYWEYEQRGGFGTDFRTRNYGLTKGSEFHAYRPNKIR